MINFDKYYQKMLTSSIIEKDRLPQVRASAVPFCPKKYLYSFYENYKNGGSPFDYPFDFYVTLGTAIHSLIQRWLTRPLENKDILFGHWKCTNWNCKHMTLYKIGPITCPNCKSEMTYEELKIDFLNSIMEGHCDGVVLDIENIVDGVVQGWVLELKSTSIWNINNIKEPKYEHNLQASIYVSALRAIFDKYGQEIFRGLKANGKKIKRIDLQGYILKYVARERPDLRASDLIVEVKKDTVYNITGKYVNTFYEAIMNDNVDLLLKKFPCKKYPETYVKCKYESLCTEKKKKHNKDLVSIFNDIRPVIYDLFINKGFKIFAGDLE